MFSRSVRVLVGCLIVATWVRSDSQPVGAQRPAAEAAAPASSEAAILKQYCIGCHNERFKSGGLALDTLSVDHVAPDAETWEKVVRKVRTGMMPPIGSPRPDRAALDVFAAALETRLDGSSASELSLSTPALHRLNRTEYANAVRDLLALDVDATVLLPPDGSLEGFDNIADALRVSPSLVQGYVSAALKISRQAVGDRTMAPQQIVYTAPNGLSQDRHLDGLPLGTRGGMLVRHTFPLDAEYEITIGGGRGGGGGEFGGTILTVDGERIIPPAGRGFRLPVTAGPHTIGLAVADRQRSPGADDIYSDHRVDAEFRVAGGVQSFTIVGPFNPTGVNDTPSRRKIFVCQPATVAEEEPCARNILTRLARRAYRGPVQEGEIATLMSFYQQGRKDGDFETGVQHALARLLVAPRFIFRAEEDPENVRAGEVFRVNDYELASRLSFFLWSSIPDDELLELAAKGRLRDRAVVQQQVKRMLADRRSDALIENFAGQWLYLRELQDFQTEAEDFDANLRSAFRRETEMLFGAIVREDRSLLELLDSDFTFVDERLAKHYGIPNVRGSHFRRVALPSDSPRKGIIGQGSMLTVTSVATRTSPVMRGKWILENLLGTKTPEPPPGVETNLEPDPDATAPTTLRQRLELHRASPVCASCHRVMDPLGFSLENFDLIGAWRDTENGAAIDASGQLADGTVLAGPADLRRAVLGRSTAFMTTVTEKLLMYALGRGVHYYDMPHVRAIARQATADDYRFSSLVLGIVESDPFQRRIKKTGQEGH